jgi:hypothetical protein
MRIDPKGAARAPFVVSSYAFGMTKARTRRPLLVGSALLLAGVAGCATPTATSSNAAPACRVDGAYTPQACGFVGVTRARSRRRVRPA